MLIQFDNVKKSYRIGSTEYQALKGISFSVKQGELVAIVGPSGSGKTTTMNILGLLDKPTSGTYYLDGLNTAEFSNDQLAALRNQQLGFIFQHYFLLPRLSALDNVMLPLTYRHDDKISAEEMKTRAMEMLRHVEMENFAFHKPLELSGGQQQRIAIARALIGKPKIILADEPTGALDTKTSQQIIALLKSRMQETKTTVIVITHSVDLAKQCDRAIHVSDGLIQES